MYKRRYLNAVHEMTGLCYAPTHINLWSVICLKEFIPCSWVFRSLHQNMPHPLRTTGSSLGRRWCWYCRSGCSPYGQKSERQEPREKSHHFSKVILEVLIVRNRVSTVVPAYWLLPFGFWPITFRTVHERYYLRKKSLIHSLPERIRFTVIENKKIFI